MIQTITDFGRFFGLLFLTGIPVSVAICVVLAFALDRAKKRAVRTAEEAGVEFTPPPERGPSVSEIQGTIYCIGFIIVAIIFVVATVLGISLPIELSDEVKTIVVTVVVGIFGIFLWALIVWIPFYYRAQRRRVQRELEEALSHKGL
jgi:quinol-cytochrome oxidoreductase complex cytochrome b subunit